MRNMMKWNHPFLQHLCLLPVCLLLKTAHELDAFSSWLLFLGHLGHWISLEHIIAFQNHLQMHINKSRFLSLCKLIVLLHCNENESAETTSCLTDYSVDCLSHLLSINSIYKHLFPISQMRRFAVSLIIEYPLLNIFDRQRRQIDLESNSWCILHYFVRFHTVNEW